MKFHNLPVLLVGRIRIYYNKTYEYKLLQEGMKYFLEGVRESLAEEIRQERYRMELEDSLFLDHLWLFYVSEYERKISQRKRMEKLNPNLHKLDYTAFSRSYKAFMKDLYNAMTLTTHNPGNDVLK